MDLSALTPGQRAQGKATGLVYAEIASTPADESEDVMVLIGSATQQDGPCLWMPRGATLPSRGDPCYVQEAVNGRSIVVWWRPA